MTPLALRTWATRHSVSDAALLELAQLVGVHVPIAEGEGGSEASVQARVRLEAPGAGCRLWRNNVGALLDSRGVPVRYGLANDSAKLNAALKSGDLIGWRRVLVTPAHVGTVIAQFLSRETKAEGWTYRGDPHEAAQKAWADLVTVEGGDARFVTGVGTL